MFDLPTLLLLVPALPLAASLLTLVLGPRVLLRQAHLPAVVLTPLAFVAAALLLVGVSREAHRAGPGGYELTRTLWTWAAIPDAYEVAPQSPAAASPRAPAQTKPFVIDVTLRADALTAVMLVVVTFVSSLVVLYSIGYMHDDPGYWRFFTYVSLFVFSMTMLVSVSNFALLYVFWEAVGVCSYLLVGFWYRKPEAAAAGQKAFLVNRVGDFGFALGVFLLWTTYGTLNFHDTADSIGILSAARAQLGYVGGGVALAICLLLLLGACAKSAQIPLHVWLPDAMEGPTPVSALIHAATMVTAGVYLVARASPLYVMAPDAQAVVAVIGASTAALGAVIALSQTDLKRVLAYSTISQLGYMFLGLGAGTLAGVTAGMFHLYTHAFFKALLFLAAGSVMHAMGGVIDMRRFGGLRRIMPTTNLAFLVGGLALAGVFPLAGFWSKDEILGALHNRGHHSPLFQACYWVGVVVAGLTAFYTFRAYFLTFFGAERVPEEAGHHAHESPLPMAGPLVVLALCTFFVAFVARDHAFGKFLATTPSLAAAGFSDAGHWPAFHMDVAWTSTLVALAGIGAAAYLFLGHTREIDYFGRVFERLQSAPGGAITSALATLFFFAPARLLYSLSAGKFFVDALYTVFLIWPLRAVSAVAAWFDNYVIDATVNLVGRLPKAVGWAMRPLQPGLLQFYALAMVLGTLVLAGSLLIWQGG